MSCADGWCGNVPCPKRGRCGCPDEMTFRTIFPTPVKPITLMEEQREFIEGCIAIDKGIKRMQRLADWWQPIGTNISVGYSDEQIKWMVDACGWKVTWPAQDIVIKGERVVCRKVRKVHESYSGTGVMSIQGSMLAIGQEYEVIVLKREPEEGV